MPIPGEAQRDIEAAIYEDLKEAVGSVLFSKQPENVKSENWMLSKDKLNKRWQLV